MEIENVILEAISQKIGEKRFEMWFGKDIHFKLHHSVLFVTLPTLFLCNWIRTNFKHVIAQVCEELFGKVYEMEFRVADNQEMLVLQKADSLLDSSQNNSSRTISHESNGNIRGNNFVQANQLKINSQSVEFPLNQVKDQKKAEKSSKKIQRNSLMDQDSVYQVNVSNDRPISFSQIAKEGSENKKQKRQLDLSSQKNSDRNRINDNFATDNDFADDNIIVNNNHIAKNRTSIKNDDSIENTKDQSAVQLLNFNDMNHSSSNIEEVSNSSRSNSSKTNVQFSDFARSNSDSLSSSQQNSGRSNSLRMNSVLPDSFDFENTDSVDALDRSAKMRETQLFDFSLKSNNLPLDSAQESPLTFHSQENSKRSTGKKSPSSKNSRTTKINASESLNVSQPTKSSETPLFLTDEKGNFNIVPHQSPKAAGASRSFSDQDRKFASYSTFVVGLSNRLAKSVSDLIILEPGKMSPLMIYGSTSVGKTHLLEGIWSEYRRKQNRRSPLFMTAEQFTSQFIWSLRTNGQPFRNRFKNISLFVLDDLQFLQGKISTQTELLNLIDYLKSQNVQMVFSADRPLSDLSGLKSEIISRIEGGIVCQIESPERETLLGIFRQMMKKRHLNIPEEVCRFIVSRFTTHARQLSGVLNRLHASHLATGQPFSLEMAEDSLKDIIRSNHRTVHLEDIEKAVKDIFGLADNSLQSRSRTKQVCYPRMLAMWLARKHTKNALSEIGRYFGNRSHSTVISAQKKVEQWLLDNNSPLEQGEYVWTVSETIQRIERILSH